MEDRRTRGMKNFMRTGIYALTAEPLSQGRTNLAVVDAMIRAGVKFLQYREKEKTARVMYEECTAIRAMTRAAGVTFIINDDIGLALAVDADGVHIGQEDIPAHAVRALVGEERIIGLSTHSPAQAREAQALGCLDYIGVGPVFATRTKPDAMPTGLDYVRYAAAHIALPFVAIGGIKPHSIKEVVSAGARTVAVVSAIVGSENIETRTRELCAAVHSHAAAKNMQKAY